MSNGALHDPEDYFADTRMTFGDHLEDLRRHLWRAIIGFGLGLFISFFIGKAAVEFITNPVKEQLRAYHKRRVDKTMAELRSKPDLQEANKPTGFTEIRFLRAQLQAALKGESTEGVKRPIIKKKQNPNAEPGLLEKWMGNANEEQKLGENEQFVEPKDLVPMWIQYAEPLQDAAMRQEATRLVGDFDTLATLNIMEAFMVWFKVCMVCGFIIGSPWIFWQIWMFVAAGLYPQEKKLVHVYLPVSLGLFLTGVLICQFLVIPRAIEALLWFNEWLDLKPDLRLNEWLSFAIMMPLIFGISFQTPMVMVFLARLGVVNGDTFRNKRRYAWMGMAIFAALITPTPDAMSMLFLWVPMCMLFELGIWLIRFQRPEPELSEDATDTHEMIEV